MFRRRGCFIYGYTAGGGAGGHAGGSGASVRDRSSGEGDGLQGGDDRGALSPGGDPNHSHTLHACSYRMPRPLFVLCVLAFKLLKSNTLNKRRIVNRGIRSQLVIETDKDTVYYRKVKSTTLVSVRLPLAKDPPDYRTGQILTLARSNRIRRLTGGAAAG
eukprot:9179967-Pyramimonas_sp.AAC.2